MEVCVSKAVLSPEERERALEQIREEIFRFCVEYQGNYKRATKYQFIGQRWNRRAAKLGVTLRDLIDGDRRMLTHMLPTGGTNILIADAVAARKYRPDFSLE